MFRVGVTGDFLKADGTLGFGDIGLDLFEGSDVSWEFLPAGSEISPEQARDYDGLLVAKARVNALITTLGTLGIFQGIAILIAGPSISNYISRNRCCRQFADDADGLCRL
jgi:hypothetical protein